VTLLYWSDLKRAYEDGFANIHGDDSAPNDRGHGRLLYLQMPGQLKWLEDHPKDLN
jgi:hypothetical protein